MSLWNWLFDDTAGEFNLDAHSTTASQAAGPVNPATGLPMVSGDWTGIDVGGSPFGFDLYSSAPTSLGGDSFDSFSPWST